MNRDQPDKLKPGRPALPPVTPLRPLSGEDLQLLDGGDIERFFAGRRAEYIEAVHAIIMLSPREASRYSFGWGVILKALDLAWRQAFPAVHHFTLDAEIKTSTDAELFELLALVGVEKLPPDLAPARVLPSEAGEAER